MKYRRKLDAIDAIQYTGNNFNQIVEFAGHHSVSADGNIIVICFGKGRMMASVGDYIVRSADGEFYPYNASRFEKTYEKVEE